MRVSVVGEIAFDMYHTLKAVLVRRPAWCEVALFNNFSSFCRSIYYGKDSSTLYTIPLFILLIIKMFDEHTVPRLILMKCGIVGSIKEKMSSYLP